MVKKSFTDMPCSLAQSLNVIGEWWSMLIIRDFFIGGGVRRFEQLHAALGISRNILTERLKTLTEEGVLERVPLQEGGKRCAYQLTAKGRDLLPVMIAMMQWGEKWQMDPDDRVVVIRDRRSGAEIEPLQLQNPAGDTVAAHDLLVTVRSSRGEHELTEWPPAHWAQRGVEAEQ